MSELAAPRPIAVGGRRALSLLEWIAGVDHKVIGTLYVAAAIVFLFVGGIEAMIIRAQLALPGEKLVTPEQYNQIFTMHGTTMIFLMAMPLLTGVANYLVPLMIGAREVAFPRLNAFSFWLFLFGGVLLNFSLLTADAPNVGWFAYAPLTERAFTTGLGVDYWALAMILLGAASIAGAINLGVTILALRAPGMGLTSIPLFVWTVLVQILMILGALPSLTGAALLLLLDRQVGAHFFDATVSGQPVLWQHLFWFFGHPEVYIVILPVFGMISEVVPVFSRKPLFGQGFVMGSSMVIAVLSFMVWAHHMFAVGLSIPELAFFSAASMAIAVPTGIKIFNWTATLWGGSLRLNVALLFAIGFIAEFVFGGLTGVSVATVPFDWQAEDSYYIVAHFHYTLFGGTVFGALAGFYYWFPKVTGRLLSERLGRWHFWLTFVGFNLTFLPQHVVGLMGMPRRVYTYQAGLGWEPYNVASTIGAFILGFSFLVFAWNVVRTLRVGALAGSDPWDAWTLEWSIPSPPPPGNFAAIPTVRSRRPLWDRKHPEAPDRPRRDVGRVFRRIRLATLGVALFVGSESIFFASVIAAYIVAHPVDEAKALLDVPRTLIFSLFLFASSGTITFAARGRRTFWVLVTMLFGAIFLTGQALEYWRLINVDAVTFHGSLFGSGFFTLTGLHGMHVLVGLVALAVTAFLSTRPARDDRAEGVFHAVSLYWHFVDAVWVAVFTTVYLWTLL